MPTVAKRRTPQTPEPTPDPPIDPRAVDRHKSPRLAFHLPQVMADAFARYLESFPDPKPSDSAVLRHALERLLREKGFWPPPAPSQD